MTNYVHVIKDSYHQRVAPIIDSEDSLFEPAPCDECESYYYCEHYETACTDFAFYVRTGKVINENRTTSNVIYNRLFKRKKHVRT